MTKKPKQLDLDADLTLDQLRAKRNVLIARSAQATRMANVLQCRLINDGGQLIVPANNLADRLPPGTPAAPSWSALLDLLQIELTGYHEIVNISQIILQTICNLAQVLPHSNSYETILLELNALFDARNGMFADQIAMHASLRPKLAQLGVSPLAAAVTPPAAAPATPATG